MTGNGICTVHMARKMTSFFSENIIVLWAGPLSGLPRASSRNNFGPHFKNIQFFQHPYFYGTGFLMTLRN